jgi:hypothetical protein
MRTLTPSELFQVWESGLDRKPVERGIAMLRAAPGDDNAGDPARLPIGSRDARLLTLREQSFGREIRGVVSCTNCGEAIELQFSIDSLRLSAQSVPAHLGLETGEYSIEFRLPDSLDLLALGEDPPDEGRLRQSLLDRCLCRATRLGGPVAVGDLPEMVIEDIARAMAAADPQAEMELSLQCSACQRQWQEPFDIESFLWGEIQAWAARMLFEIHQLAAAYGWSEAEILTLSPVRRSAYLSFITES